MDEDNKTVQEDVQAAPEQGQPASEDIQNETLDAETTSEPSETQQASDENESQAAPDVDDELQKFARSQGIELDSPNAIKAAQALQKARSEATRNYQKASELEKSVAITQDQMAPNASEIDLLRAEQRNTTLQLAAMRWKAQNPDKVAMEQDMIKILTNDPGKKILVQEGYLTYDDVYKLAKADTPDNSAAVESRGATKALTNLAHKQQAAVPTGHATNQGTTPKDKPFGELSIQEMEQKLGKVRY